MARLLVRLKLRLLGNTLQRGWQPAMGLVIGALVGLLIAVPVAVGLAATSSAPSWADAVTVVSSIVWIGWLVVPATTLSSDDTLDPRRFAMLPLTARDLVPGLALSALVGVGPVVTFAATSGAIVGVGQRTSSPLAVLVGAVVAMLVVVVSVVTSRAVLAVVADVVASRRGRDVMGFLVILVAIGAAALPSVMGNATNWFAQAGFMADAANVAVWTPGGLTGSAIGEVVDGNVAAAALRLGGTLGWTAGALGLWAWAIRRVQSRTPGHSRATPQKAGGLYPRVLSWMPRTPSSAVAVRFLRMLARDVRARNQLLSQTFLLVPLLVLTVGAGTGGVSTPLIAAVAVVPFGLVAANQLGLDGPALWTHEVAGADPRRDMKGRGLALGLLAAPLVLVAAVLLAAVFSAWVSLPAAVLLAAAMFLAMLGVGNTASVLTPFSLPEDPSNMFGSSSSNAGCLQGVVVMVVMAANVVVVLPVVVPMAVVAHPMARTAIAAAGVAYGAAVFLGGSWLAEQRAAGRGPELLLAIDPRTQ